VARVAQQFKVQNECRQEVTVSLLHKLLKASSDVRHMAVSELTLGASMETVAHRFPDMKFETNDHPGGPGVVYTRSGRYESEDGSLDVQATLSRDGHLLALITDRLFILEEPLSQIRDRLIEQYGPPDRVRGGKGFAFDYKQSDARGQRSARLHISVNVVRHPVQICDLPRHLRNGRTVARFRAQLYDEAGSAENTRKTIADIREWKVDAVQAQAAAEERRIREIMARQAAILNNC
jgi:hypothetical protein